MKGHVLAGRHRVSVGFLENILAELRRAAIVASKRGGHGGYWLARPAAAVTVADVSAVLGGAGRIESSTPPDGLQPVLRCPEVSCAVPTVASGSARPYGGAP